MFRSLFRSSTSNNNNDRRKSYRGDTEDDDHHRSRDSSRYDGDSSSVDRATRGETVGDAERKGHGSSSSSSVEKRPPFGLKKLDQRKALILAVAVASLCLVLVVLFLVLFVKEKKTNKSLKETVARMALRNNPAVDHQTSTNKPFGGLPSATGQPQGTTTTLNDQRDAVVVSAAATERKTGGRRKEEDVGGQLGFRFDRQSVLASFDPVFQPKNACTWLRYEFSVKPKSSGYIAWCKLGQRGWSLGIDDKDNALVFQSEGKTIRSREPETLENRHTYAIQFRAELLQIIRDDREVCRGRWLHLQGQGPLLLGVGLQKYKTESTGSMRYRPTGLLLGKIYDASFTIRGKLMGRYSFSTGQSLQSATEQGQTRPTASNWSHTFEEEQGRTDAVFVARKASEFVFEAE